MLAHHGERHPALAEPRQGGASLDLTRGFVEPPLDLIGRNLDVERVLPRTRGFHLKIHAI
jgi:hypothetical protein